MLRTALVALFVFAGLSFAGEKRLMHCFVFTVIDTASQADWDAFAKATDAIPGKINVVKRVWHGKLMRPLAQFSTNAETRKKLAAGETSATGPVQMRSRQHGVCMELENEAALKTYADHPYHKDWVTAYEKVRVAGTTTFDIIGQ